MGLLELSVFHWLDSLPEFPETGTVLDQLALLIEFGGIGRRTQDHLLCDTQILCLATVISNFKFCQFYLEALLMILLNGQP